MEAQKRAAAQWKRTAAKTHVMTSDDIRWQAYLIQFSARDQGSANVKGRTER
jgi:hypothetical protein